MTENQQTITDSDAHNQKKFGFHATTVRRLTIAVLKIIIPLLPKRQINGTENLPAEGLVILAANNLTNYHVFPIQLCLPRPLFFYGEG